MLEPVVVAVVAEHVLGPQSTHQFDLLLLAPTTVPELLVQRVVLDRVPADPDAEHESVVRQDRHLGGLLGDQHRLALRQDQDRRDELDVLGAGGEEPEQHHRLVERRVRVVRALEPAGPVAVDADHVVVDQQVRHARVPPRPARTP